jgi:hypothetical protein
VEVKTEDTLFNLRFSSMYNIFYLSSFTLRQRHKAVKLLTVYNRYNIIYTYRNELAPQYVNIFILMFFSRSLYSNRIKSSTCVTLITAVKFLFKDFKVAETSIQNTSNQWRNEGPAFVNVMKPSRIVINWESLRHLQQKLMYIYPACDIYVCISVQTY